MAGPLAVGGAIDTKQLEQMLKKLVTSTTNLRPFFFLVDRDVTALLRAQWETRGARLGTPWAPLSPVTPILRVYRRMETARARKRALAAKGADTPLRDTGRLWSSFTKPGAPGSIRIIDQLRYERGSSYTVGGFAVAAAMQQGFKSVYRPILTKLGDVIFVRRKTPTHVPARVIIPEALPAPVMKTWEGYLVQYLEQGTLASGGPLGGIA